MATISEQYFEQLCSTKKIRWERIAESDTRSADYKIWLDNTMVIAEVKQLNLNEDDRKFISAVQNGTEVPSVFRATGHIRVRNALDNAYLQLKNIAKEDHPAILIIYDNTQGLAHLGHDDILKAMYGDETVIINWPEQEPTKSKLVAHRFGGKRRVTQNSYRALSGIGLLSYDESQQRLKLDVFHNMHARKQLEKTLIWFVADRQFTIANSENYQDWVQIMR